MKCAARKAAGILVLAAGTLAFFAEAPALFLCFVLMKGAWALAFIPTPAAQWVEVPPPPGYGIIFPASDVARVEVAVPAPVPWEQKHCKKYLAVFYRYHGMVFASARLDAAWPETFRNGCVRAVSGTRVLISPYRDESRFEAVILTVVFALLVVSLACIGVVGVVGGAWLVRGYFPWGELLREWISRQPRTTPDEPLDAWDGGVPRSSAGLHPSHITPDQRR